MTGPQSVTVSPLSILALGNTPRIPRDKDPVRVDADTFVKLCERPGAQRFILDESIYGVLVDGVAYHRAN